MVNHRPEKHGDIQPIETHYKGYRFRSRLEARWAVFLDAFGMDYEYEKQGYVVDGTPYLPDFWIPYDVPPCRKDGWGFFLEIKPIDLTEDQKGMLDELARTSGHRVYAVCGQPWPGEHVVRVFQHYHNGQPESIPLLSGSLRESENGIGRGVRVFQKSPEASFPFPTPCGYYSVKNGRLKQAFRAARSARFEHGETPDPKSGR